MNKADLKNNKGFSLVELLAIMAIMSLAVGALVLSARLVTGADAKQIAQKYAAHLDEVKTSSMSRYGLNITLGYHDKDDDNYSSDGYYTVTTYSSLGKDKDGKAVEVENITDDSGNVKKAVEHRKVGRDNVEVLITYFDGANLQENVLIDTVDTNFVKIRFNRNSGGIESFYVNDLDPAKEMKASDGCYIDNFTFKAGKREYFLKFDHVTGKHWME